MILSPDIRGVFRAMEQSIGDDHALDYDTELRLRYRIRITFQLDDIDRWQSMGLFDVIL